jgi:hypothetical protein
MTARARLLLAIGAYVCLATHLMAMLHVVVVRHGTCPDHGELVHGAAPVVVAAVVPTDRTARDATREAAEEPDEHCLLLATRRRELAALAPGNHPLLLAPAPDTRDFLPIIAPPPPRALLLIAPKTSPPTVA